MMSWAFYKADKDQSEDFDSNRRRTVDKWIAELSEIHVFRQQADGLVWMHDDVREKLRERVCKELADPNNSN